jgi:hypothetical protein
MFALSREDGPHRRDTQAMTLSSVIWRDPLTRKPFRLTKTMCFEGGDAGAPDLLQSGGAMLACS